MLALDLFSGTGGATRELRRRGWDVVGVDSDPRHEPDVVADLAAWSWTGERPELVWASPPCTEFTRRDLPWTRAKYPGPPPMDLVHAALRIIAETRPRYWVIENVRGAIKWFRPLLGAPRRTCYPFFLWGEFPELGAVKIQRRYKSDRSGDASGVRRRATVPAALALALADAVERELRLFGVRLPSDPWRQTALPLGTP